MLLNKRIPPGYILSKISVDLAVVILVSVIVHLLKNRYEHLLPEMPLAIPAFMGTAISVLLSFKLNQSYDRWWEARKIWGSIVNDSRTLVIQVKSFVKDSDNPLIHKIAYTQIAWCYALGQHLRGLDPTEKLKEYFTEKEINELKSSKNIPLAILSKQSFYIKKLRNTDEFDSFAHMQLDDTLVRLCESQGKCERIKNTVFPVTYRKFLHFMIYLFVCTLSVALDNIEARFELPLLIGISSVFFLLENSAIQLQDPFENRPSDTAVTTIARTIEINIRQLLKESNVPAPMEQEEFYAL